MRIVFMIALLCLLPVGALAESGDMPCIRGNCEGWSGSYVNENNITATYTFNNNSGKPAFNIKYRLLFYTYLDDFVATIQNNIEGPITRKTSFTARWPDKASKVQFEIYWSEEPQQK
jgi:hypothetical protein